MAGVSNKITNIIGTPLPNFVRQQFKTRSEKSTLENRDDTNLVYLANKTGWIRVASSVDLIIETDLAYFKSLLSNSEFQVNEALTLQDQQSLAEQFILYGGTSKYRKTDNGFSYDLRYGLGNNGAYGMLGPDEVKEYGYKPMPGITSAKITTQGRLGSVRSAEISFKVWDKYQLDIIDALYLKLGFSMFIEWGNTTFYNATTNKLESGEDYAIDVFDQKITQDKDTVRTRIYQNIVQSEGNYDAMLGIVTNFNYSFSQDGGYDCSIRVLSLGVLADSMKINKIKELPNIAKDQISNIFNSLQSLEKRSAAVKQAEKQAELDAIVAATRNQQDETSATLQLQNYDDFVKLVVNTTNPKVKDSFAITEVQGSVNKNYYAEVKNTRDAGVKLAVLKNLSDIIRLYNDSRYNVSIKVPSILSTANEYWNRLEQTGVGASYENNTHGDIKSLAQNDIAIDDKLDKNKEKYINLRKYPNPANKYDAPQYSQFNESNNNNPSVDNAGVGIAYTVGTSAFRINVVFGLIGSYVDGHDAKVQSFKEGTPITFTPTDAKKVEDRLNFAISEVKKILPPGGTAKNLLLQSESDPIFKDYFDIKAGGDPFTPYQGKLSVRLKTYYSVNTTVDSETSATGVANGQKKVTAFYPIWIIFNDSDIITSAKVLKDDGGSGTATNDEEETGTGTATAKPITVGDVQKSEAMKYKSALEIMLRTIQLKHIAQVVPKINIGTGGSYVLQNVQNINLSDGKYFNSFTMPLFSAGLFTSFLPELISGSIGDIDPNKILNDTNTLIKVESKYGFNYNLMKDPKGFLALLQRSNTLQEELAVDYKSLMNTYLVPYNVQNTLGEGLNIPTYPVYVTFGFFIMMLNHMCVLYNEQEEDKKIKKPLIYIDYNNKTNFCLANELVMSTNPLAFLIPFEGSRESYAKLFDTVIEPGSFTIRPDSGSAQELFDPTKKDQNPLSAVLSPKYRYTNDSDKNSAYRGNIMNIFVNIDYLLNTIDGFVKEDDENTVYLKPLLEKLITDMNKSLGNINVFRIAFNDYADTYHIIDDQLVPTIPTEDVIKTDGNSSNSSKSSPNDMVGNDTVLNLYGKNSIANSLEVKTEISTRLSNMIAISANAKIDQKYAASKDASSVGYLNAGFQDRYKKNIVDQGPTTGSKSNDTTKNSAIQINETIKNFYSTDSAPLDRISQLTNYYIEKMNKIKSVEPPTRASALIPVSVNFSTDGISGLAMGQSFTVQDELLPYSYTTRKMPYGIPSQGKKVGFVIIGLDHEISNNRWTTSVRSNMYFIKDQNIYNGIVLNNMNASSAKLSTIQSTTTSYEQTNFKAENSEAKKAVENYLGRLITDLEWSQLVSATYAEASGNQTERAWVMAVILNRTRNSGKSITDTLTAKNQFQSVTGTSADGNRPSPNYVNGPGAKDATSIYGAAVNILSQVPKNYIFFTSNNEAAYGPGTDIQFLFKLRNNIASKIIGQTVFSTTA